MPNLVVIAAKDVLSKCCYFRSNSSPATACDEDKVCEWGRERFRGCENGAKNERRNLRDLLEFLETRFLLLRFGVWSVRGELRSEDKEVRVYISVREVV